MKTKYKIIIINWLPVIIWAIVIFSFSSIKQISVSNFFVWDFITKKIAHVSEYAILYYLIFRATKGNWVTSFLWTILYAMTDEIHQKFVPGRSSTLIDLGFDISGANIAGYIIWKLKQLQNTKPKK